MLLGVPSNGEGAVTSALAAERPSVLRSAGSLPSLKPGGICLLGKCVCFWVEKYTPFLKEQGSRGDMWSPFWPSTPELGEDVFRSVGEKLEEADLGPGSQMTVLSQNRHLTAKLFN